MLSITDTITDRAWAAQEAAHERADHEADVVDRTEASIAEQVVRALRAGRGMVPDVRVIDGDDEEYEADATCELSEATAGKLFVPLMRTVLTLDAPEVEALRQYIACVHARQVAATIAHLRDAEESEL